MSDTLTTYFVPPQMEFKAAQELERAGIAYELPRETITRQAQGRKPTTRDVPIIRGYIHAERKPLDAKHIRRPLGRVSRSDLIRCQTDMDRRQRRADDDQNPFQPGQAAYKGEIPVTVDHIRGRSCVISWAMLGKRMSQAIHYTQLRPG